MSNNLIEKVKRSVKETFQENHDKRATYHSYEHVCEVAEAAENIGKECKLNDEELEVVIVASWFHDTGYLYQREDHESYSVKVADEYLKSIGYPEEKMKKVANCILATRMDHIPSDLMQEVIRDADTSNLAGKDNFKQAKLLRREFVNYGMAEPVEEEWLTGELKFLMSHRYYTDSAKKELDKKKGDYIKRIKKKIRKSREKEEDLPTGTLPADKISSNGHEDVLTMDRKEVESDEKKAEDKKEVTIIKGFESIYKLIATNHMRLNAIADRKANIMLTLNGIIISLTISIVASDSDSNARLIIPTSILIVVCLLSIIFATLSTRPKITPGSTDKQDIIDKKANLLFFGNFSRMTFEDFDWGIRKVMEDQDYLHNVMIQDFYNLGKVLDMKFRYLRICYNIFMYGIILSVISITVLIGTGR